MIRRLMPIALFLVAALEGNAVAQTSVNRALPQMSFNGVGVHSCGVYLENVKGLASKDYKVWYQQWGAGFMAGASNDGQGANPHTDLETYTAWLDKWCADDPASNVRSGVIALGKRLARGK